MYKYTIRWISPSGYLTSHIECEKPIYYNPKTNIYQFLDSDDKPMFEIHKSRILYIDQRIRLEDIDKETVE